MRTWEECSCVSASVHARRWGAQTELGCYLIAYGMHGSVPELARNIYLFMKKHLGRPNSAPSTGLGMGWSQAWGRERF